MISRKISLALLAVLASISLSACGSGPAEEGGPVATLPDVKKVDKTILYGERRESLSSIESLYGAHSNDPIIAARYAKALRESGNLKKAEQILAPLVKQKNVPTLVYAETAALQLENGKFLSAENSARRAIKVDENNYRAWHILGIALDAQEKHPAAESALRKALEIWKGDDDVPVMNNLALNLAAQGYTDKALDILYNAKAKDPSRKEIERNIRIIRTLNEPADYNLAKKGVTAAEVTKQTEEAKKKKTTTNKEKKETKETKETKK